MNRSRAVLGTAASVVLGGVLAVLTALPSSENLQLAIIVGLATTLLGGGVTFYLEVQNRLEELDKRAILVAPLQDLYTAPEVEVPVCRAVDSILEAKTERTPFIFARLVEHTNRFSDVAHAISEGTFICDPADEPYLTKELISTCERSLKAVSFQDEPWWTGPDGRAYLEQHKRILDARKNQISMTRVFLVPQAAEEGLREALSLHQDLGIEVFMLRPETVTEPLRRDFVIYDDRLVREAEAVQRGTLQKRAHFSEKERDVRQALRDFDRVLDLAHAAGISPKGAP